MIHSRLLATVLCCSMLVGLQAAEHSPDPDRIRQHAEAIIALGDRSMGSEGANRTIDYLKQELVAAGIDAKDIHSRRTTVTVPVDKPGPDGKASHLRVNGQDIRIFPHRPNFNAPSSTYGKTITGPLLYVGRGTTNELRGKQVEGSIVILDGDSDEAWLKCAELGALAVVFIHPDRIDARQLQAQFIEASLASCPRFVSAKLDPTLSGQEASLTSHVAFEQRSVTTLVVEILGRGNNNEAKAAVLTAGYEAAGNIRGLDPASTRAWNTATLLEICRQFKSMPLERDVIAIFHGARAEGFRGLRETLGSISDLENNKGDGTLNETIKWPDAPLGDAETVDIITQIWRTDLINDDFNTFLTQEDRSQQALIKLLQTIDYTPEDKHLFAGLNYPPEADADTAAAAAGNNDGGDRHLIVWIGLLVLIVCAFALVIIHFKYPVFNWYATFACMIPLFFIGKSLLTPPEVFTSTDIEAEQKEVLKLGYLFISEEAARRADRLGPIMENLRLLNALLKKWTPEEQAKIGNNENRKRRWDKDLSSMLRTREELAAQPLKLTDGRSLNQAMQTDMDITKADDAYRANIDKLATELSDLYHRWRNVQQKLGKVDLTEEEVGYLPDLIGAVCKAPEGSVSQLERNRQILETRRLDYMSGIQLRNKLTNTKIGLIVALDFSDGGDQYSSLCKGWLVGWTNLKLNKSVGYVADTLQGKELKGILPFTGKPYELGDESGAWWHKGYIHGAGMVGHFAPAMTLSTVLDERPKIGTPQDTAEAFNSDRFLTQTKGLTLFLDRLVNEPDILEQRFNMRPTYRTVQAQIQTQSEGSVDGRKGFPFPLLTLYLGDAMQVGGNFKPFNRDVRLIERHYGDAFGIVRIPWIPGGLKDFPGKKFSTSVCGFDDTGAISHVVASGGVHKGKGVDNSAFDMKRIRNMLVNVFECEVSEVYGIYDPRLLKNLAQVSVLSAARDSQPDYVHKELHNGTAVIFGPPGVRLRILAAEGEIGNRMLLLGDHLGDGEFRGLYPGSSLSTEPILPPATRTEGMKEAEVDAAKRQRVPTSMAVAGDMLQLCKKRLNDLQKNGINPESSWVMLAEGQRRYEEAVRAFDAGDADFAAAQAQASWSYLANVYPAVLATANDVVYGLVVMLLLAIPFAMICERLFIGGNTIGRKVGGFSLFFVGVFLFFFFLHPAFSLATTPVIIFLAFTIILLSSLVIGILYSRFEHEMQLIRMAGLGMHTADVSRLGTLLATGQLGISNMRRRPLRTFLTAITVVLMTFILLTFASFKNSADTRVLSLGIPPTYNGILVVQPGYSAISKETIQRIENNWGSKLNIYQRRWLQSDDERPNLPIVGTEGSTVIEGLVGIQAEDPSGLEDALIRGAADDPNAPRGFDPEAPKEWLFLPPAMLETMGVEAGTEQLFMGHKVRLGSLNIDTLANTTHLGGDPITPLSMAAMSEDQREEIKQQKEMATTGSGSMEVASFTHMSPEAIGVAHIDLIQDLDGELTSFALVPYSREEATELTASTGRKVSSAEEISIDEVATDMAHQMALTLTVGDKGDSYYLTSVSGVAMTGLADVLIPLILGGLIIFSTMLGSVAERGKEIFIYSSLGLAPIHIGALFLVEASIYAVLGGLGGYIVAQALVAGLGVAADLGFGVQPDLNYSSFTAVVTILMVMATVLLSALYPAYVASSSAKPGEDNEFKIPAAVDDQLEIPFPFTVARRDVQGLLAFLKTYFDANTEASTGSFTAADAVMESVPEKHAYLVRAKTWLAPFDLGISQYFRMTANRTDVPAIFSIHISLELLSGQRNAWRRVLMPFLKELRRQFLVWRTLDEETMDRYRAEGGDHEAQDRIAARDAEEKRQREEEEQNMGSSHRDQAKMRLAAEQGEDASSDDADPAAEETDKPKDDSGEEARS